MDFGPTANSAIHLPLASYFTSLCHSPFFVNGDILIITVFSKDNEIQGCTVPYKS